jgi:hypothetical protein
MSLASKDTLTVSKSVVDLIRCVSPMEKSLILGGDGLLVHDGHDRHLQSHLLPRAKTQDDIHTLYAHLPSARGLDSTCGRTLLCSSLIEKRVLILAIINLVTGFTACTPSWLHLDLS